jgi:hypothetical protein
MAITKRVVHTEKEKYEAVALYKLVGSLQLVANMTGIPRDTLAKWHVSDWWKDYELDIIQQNRAQTSKKLGKIVEKAMIVVQDRLEEGDYLFNSRTGKFVRKPINAHVANKILQDSMSREAMIDQLNQESKKAMTEEKMADRLLKLAETFKLMSGKRQVIDVEVVDPQPDQENVTEAVLEALPVTDSTPG